MILAIVESWSFKVPWIVNWIRNFNRNFVFFFFFFLRRISTKKKKSMDFKEEIPATDLFAFTSFLISRIVILSLHVYGNILRGKNYPDIFTNKEFLFNIYRRFSFQTCYCELAFVFILRWIFRSLIVKQLVETICRFHFRNAIATSETLSRNFLFNYRLL